MSSLNRPQLLSFSLVLGVLLPSMTVSATEQKPSYFQDVRPIIEEKCILCHSDKSVSFSFENAETTYGYRHAIRRAVKEQRMPPWMAEEGHQLYEDDYSLSKKQRKLIERWAKQGYVKGEEPARASAVPSVVSIDEFKSDISLDVLPPNLSYLPNQEQKDDYRCFVMPWPYKTTKYVTGFKGSPGNQRIAHHLITYAVTPDVAPIFLKLSQDEGGKGYSCFGGPLPDKLADKSVLETFKKRYNTDLDTLNANNYWLSHWAPGMMGYAFPDNTGVKMEPGAAIVVQVHYYSAYAPGESDQGSVMHYMVKDKVEKPALIYPLSNYDWFGGRQNKSMVIPPGKKSTFYASDSFDKIANLATTILGMPKDDIETMELHSANIHMHSYGLSGETTLLDPDGKKETLLNIPRWDKDWQRDFGLKQPKIISSEDFSGTRLTVECDFINHQDRLIYGGFGSDDEMCFNFSYIAVTQKSENVPAPKLVSK